MTSIDATAPRETSRAALLKAATRAAHEQLDRSIMAGAPFASRERYARFLQVQHGFHREIDALYSDPTLALLLPDLAGRRRFDVIEQDLGDLGAGLPDYGSPPVFLKDSAAELPAALGWLYVAEGSNLGGHSC